MRLLFVIAFSVLIFSLATRSYAYDDWVDGSIAHYGEESKSPIPLSVIVVGGIVFVLWRVYG